MKSGESSTIKANATSPDNAEITGYSYTVSAGTVSGSGTSATLDTTNQPAGTINVTATATDSRGLTGTCTTSVGVIGPTVSCANIEDWGECTFEKNPKKPWRVDNDCKDTLDKLSLRLQQMPNGKLEIVGYTDEKESVNMQQLGAQRSVNVKYYLTTDGPTKVDASRVQPRQGGTKGQATHFYFVPEGNLCSGQVEEGTVVDETAVQPQSRNAPAPKHHKAKAKKGCRNSLWKLATDNHKQPGPTINLVGLLNLRPCRWEYTFPPPHAITAMGFEYEAVIQTPTPAKLAASHATAQKPSH